MGAATAKFVRGICGCGRRLRIRNAVPGAQITCPKCGRLIAVTAEDIRNGYVSRDAFYVAPDLDAPGQGEPPVEAIPLSAAGMIRPAREGGRPGITDGLVLTNEDSALKGAMAGVTGSQLGYGSRKRRRSFTEDLAASFYFAGEYKNALNIVATAIGMTLLAFLAAVFPGSWVIGIILPFGVVSVYAMQFNFLVFDTTVAGEDEVPWFPADWDMWEDVIAPVWRIGAISFACSIPAIAYSVVARGQTDPIIAVVLLAAGWLLWPIGVMTITLGNSIFCFHPEVLIRSIFAIGPRYLLAYLLVICILIGWSMFPFVFRRTGNIAVFAAVSAVAPLVNLYFGYVLFRTLGLLYRHFSSRLPWRA